MEVVMKRSASVLMMGLCIFSAEAQPPSLEGQVTLPNVVNGSVSVVSDGYGQHFIKIEPSGNITHYLVGNDGIELQAYRGTVSATGTFPVVTSYSGKLRTTFSIGTTFTAGSIYNIDAYTDFYGTHIVWQDRSDFASEPEVYYVRWDDD